MSLEEDCQEPAILTVRELCYAARDLKVPNAGKLIADIMSRVSALSGLVAMKVGGVESTPWTTLDQNESRFTGDEASVAKLREYEGAL